MKDSDSGCMVLTGVVGVAILIYKLAKKPLSELAQDGATIVAFLCLFGGSFLVYKLLAKIFDEWVDESDGKKVILAIPSLIFGITLAILAVKIEALTIALGVILFLAIIIALCIWIFAHMSH